MCKKLKNAKKNVFLLSLHQNTGWMFYLQIKEKPVKSGNILFLFCVFSSFCTKNAENEDFDQCLECTVPKRWSKYTTLLCRCNYISALIPKVELREVRWCLFKDASTFCFLGYLVYPSSLEVSWDKQDIAMNPNSQVCSGCQLSLKMSMLHQHWLWLKHWASKANS